MAKRKREFTDATIERRIKEGRGFGEGKKYLPWITVRDLPSKGRCSEISGWKTNNRIHHLLSEKESQYFFTLEWSSLVTDIREQFPLLGDDNSYKETVEIANSIGVKHPIVPGSSTYNVFTTDFLITLYINGKKIVNARTVKLTEDLANKKVIEKLEIERLYWKRRNIDWKIVTEKDIDTILAYNIEFIHNYRDLNGTGLDYKTLLYCENALRIELTRKSQSIAHLTQTIDSQLGLIPGKSLSILRYLIANKVWIIDMTKKINTEIPLFAEFRDIGTNIITAAQGEY
jgi:hypothetical protein